VNGSAASVLALRRRLFLYGLLETLNGNWAMVYLSSERGVSAHGASFALTAFWAMLTVGRVLVAVISWRVPARWIYVGLSFAAIFAAGAIVAAFLAVISSLVIRRQPPTPMAQWRKRG
jgi:fucose permease